MKRIPVMEMRGGRRAVYIAFLDFATEELSCDWGNEEEFDEEWDLGHRRTFAWRLESGVDVSLTTVDGQAVHGYSLYTRADDSNGDDIRQVLAQFLEESRIESVRVLEVASP